MEPGIHGPKVCWLWKGLQVHVGQKNGAQCMELGKTRKTRAETTKQELTGEVSWRW